MRLFPLCLVLLGVGLYPESAAAQTRAESERAERLFIEASALVEKGDFGPACPKLEESQRLDPAIGTQFNLALCYEKVGRLGSAWRNYRAVERLAHSTGKKGREDASREKADEIGRRAAHLTIATVNEDASVRVDGELVAREQWAFYAVDAGEHAIEVTAPAKKGWKTRAVAPADKAAEVVVTIPKLEMAAGKSIVVERSNGKQVWGFVLGGIGIVGLGAAVTTGILALDDKSTADRQCRPTCDEEGRSAVARGKTLLPINAIACGVAVFGLGAGSYLLLTSKTSARTAILTPLVTSEMAGAHFSAKF